jgi:hypothetical protein
VEVIGEAEWRGGVQVFFFVTTKAPAVRCGRYSAPSGSLLGGNSNAFRGGVEREISSSRIEDRSCRTGEPGQAPQRGIYSSTKAIWLNS